MGKGVCQNIKIKIFYTSDVYIKLDLSFFQSTMYILWCNLTRLKHFTVVFWPIPFLINIHFKHLKYKNFYHKMRKLDLLKNYDHTNTFLVLKKGVKVKRRIFSLNKSVLTINNLFLCTKNLTEKLGSSLIRNMNSSLFFVITKIF